MSAKIIEFDREARGRMVRGADIFARAVAATLGPRGAAT